MSGSDTAILLKRVGDFVARFVVLPSESAAVAVALFVLHTWALDAAASTPYLTVVSPEKQTGKSRLLEVLAYTVRRPWHTVSTTEAALFRKIERDRPCLLLDEIDAIFGSHSERTEPLRAALNGGNRQGATVARAVGKGSKMDIKDFSVFCPKVLAGIDTGRLPDTIRDRSITLHMKRRHNGESIERLRHRLIDGDAEALRADLEAWAGTATDLLRDAAPALPTALSDRAADGWEPLFAIADLAAGGWAARARHAAEELSAGAGGEEASPRTLLLAATRAAMGDRKGIATAELLVTINADDELPFGSWNKGQGLDARGLAKLLRPYEVKARVLRIGAETARGYRADDLRDAWDRYLLPKQDGAAVTKNADEHDDVTLLHQLPPPKRTGGGEAAFAHGSRRGVTGVTGVTATLNGAYPDDGDGGRRIGLVQVAEGWPEGTIFAGRTLAELEAMTADPDSDPERDEVSILIASGGTDNGATLPDGWTDADLQALIDSEAEVMIEREEAMG